ncbi:MAG: carboxypeptidase regulatory-like domain-containing protein [Chitinophagaceae bacterium]|nr:MAG: carboxypeptidase regulatory-like domain-containing protein [Chitinophagaceae bacterium]
MKGAKNLLLSLSLLPLSLCMKASDPIDNLGKAEPVLYGSITDASTRKPVAGVLVVIRDTKTSEKKEFSTDASGNFKVPKLPFGEVTIILEKKGYKTCRREKVVITEGLSLKLDLDLKSEAREDNDYFHPMMRMMEGS